ncbi:hypothetical protein CKA32_004583 [Geitlerinema sp. FC II]|nr:hypothetical protein CKA32_004583 [Geitlerinema sp. FC II]
MTPLKFQYEETKPQGDRAIERSLSVNFLLFLNPSLTYI